MKAIALFFVVVLFPGPAFSQWDSLYVVLRGDTVDVWNRAEENCASKFIASVTVHVDSVIVVETDTSSLLALCVCPFVMRASVAGLPAGSYHAVVYRQRLKIYNPWVEDTIWLIGSVDFIIPQQSASGLSLLFVQSTCGGGIDAVSVPPVSRPGMVGNFSVYPNPFNPETTIEFSLRQNVQVALEVFDLLGRRVALLVDERRPAGTHVVRFSTEGLSSGLYVCRLTAGGESVSRYLVNLR